MNEMANQLESELRRKIEGEVRFDNGSRALYAADASNYRQTPVGVVIPKTKLDIIETVALCRKYRVPVLGRGGGTSLAGQCCNVAVVIDTSKYFNRILSIDPHRKIAVIEPGVVLDTLRDEAEKHHLTFGPDPSTHNHCTLGGMIGNNSCGVHSVMAGKTDDNVLALEILTYNGLQMRVGPTSDDQASQWIEQGHDTGLIYKKLMELRDRYGPLIKQKYPDIPRRVSGYNLPWLLKEKGFDVAKAIVGSEGTCVMVLEATVRLVTSPPVRSLVIVGYPDVYTAGDHIPDILVHRPIGLEGMDNVLVGDMKKKNLHPKDVKLLPEGKGWLLVEFGGQDKKESDAQARRMMEALKKSPHPPIDMCLYDDPPVEELLWNVRKSGLGATARIPGEKDTWEGWEDSSVPPEKLGPYLRDLRKLFEKFDYGCALYGHFGQGCVHTRIDFDMLTQAGIKKYRSFIHEAADLVMRYGGSFSGEHGDGQSRAELLPKMFGPKLMEAFRKFKSIWDPDWKMNPGKLIDAYHPTDNLRLGAHYNPKPVATKFGFPGEDEGSFIRASQRCVGVGECRRHNGKTMCPSYMVTREEKHSTRGRAHLLFEMLLGETVGKNGWKDDAVKESLDLCLACKGCKGDCPVNVDMATYKAEFLSHYYEGRLRPRSSYAFGLIYWWARLASRFPQAANFLTQAPGFSSAAKFLAGVNTRRKIPEFAGLPFKAWFFKEHRFEKREGAVRVILWPDTFNNYFHPQIARAAVHVLEILGFEVVLPKVSLCCGRPLYDFGMLGLAKRLLEQILRELKSDIEAGTPIVGLEPSCVSVFRDELCNMLPNNYDARRLSQQTYLLSEFIQKFAPDFDFPKLNQKAIVHGHCHHKSILKFDAEEALLKRLGLDFTILDSGCCGMAGSFGFEKGERYEVSMKCAQRVLFPEIKKAHANTLIITNGFSCHEQLVQGLRIKPFHLAEILEMSCKDLAKIS